MSSLINGITVTLYERTRIGTDRFGAPVYNENPVEVGNVLVAPEQTESSPAMTSIARKKASYVIAVPKGDEHVWENCRVDFLGESWRVVTHPEEGIEGMIPLDWNRKYKVVRYGA